MLSARALSSWTAGGGPCANPDITPRSPGLNWPVGSAGWALAAPAQFLSCPQSQCHASSWPREV